MPSLVLREDPLQERSVGHKKRKLPASVKLSCREVVDGGSILSQVMGCTRTREEAALFLEQM